jgi:hypothetical protein
LDLKILKIKTGIQLSLAKNQGGRVGLSNFFRRGSAQLKKSSKFVKILLGPNFFATFKLLGEEEYLKLKKIVMRV